MNNFRPVDVVGRGSETQLQVDENLAENENIWLRKFVWDNLAETG